MKPAKTVADVKKARLAKALKANLGKRKAQAKAARAAAKPGRD